MSVIGVIIIVVIIIAVCFLPEILGKYLSDLFFGKKDEKNNNYTVPEDYNAELKERAEKLEEEKRRTDNLNKK